MNEQQTIDRLVETINKLLAATLILVLAIVVIVYQHANGSVSATISTNQGDSISLVAKDTQNYWQPKDIQLITDTNLKATVDYGQNLIAHTSR